MPNWQPNWQDVRWDWAAAERAASELDRAAEALDRTSGARSQSASDATSDWFGAYRDTFDGLLSATQRISWQMAGNFREAAVRIRQASLRATEEQHSRERARERWRNEKAAEDKAKAKSTAGSHP